MSFHLLLVTSMDANHQPDQEAIEVGCHDGVPFIGFKDQHSDEWQHYGLTAENIDGLIDDLHRAKAGIR